MYGFIHATFNQEETLTTQLDPFIKFKHLIPHKLASFLEGKNPLNKQATTLLFVGMTLEGNPIGLAVASLNNGKSEPDKASYSQSLDIHLLSTESTIQDNIWVGAKLLSEVERLGISLRCHHFFLVYLQDDPSTLFFEEITLHNKWSGTRPYMITCKISRAAVSKLTMPWIYSIGGLLDDFQEFFWTDLTKKEQAQIIRGKVNNIFKPALFPPFSPVDENGKPCFETLNSLGIRHQGRVIAWMITERKASDTINYSALFVEKGFEQFMLGPKLLAHAIFYHLKSDIPWASFEIPLMQISSSWKRFVEKNIVPCTEEVKRYRLAWKEID